MNAVTAHLRDVAASPSPATGGGRHGFAVAKEFLIWGFDALGEWQDRARERRQLLGMSDRGLHDLGLARTVIDGEATRPFWRR